MNAVVHMLRSLLLALVCTGATVGAWAACGNIPSNFPAYGGASLDIGRNGVVNGVSITGTGTKSLDPSTGVKGNTALSLPSFEPATFPANASTTDLSNPTSVAAGSYDEISFGNKRSADFTGGTYHIRRIDSGGNVTLTLAPGSYFIDDFDNGNNFTLNISPAGVVKLYIQTRFRVGGQANLNVSGAVGNLQIYLYDGAQARFGNRADFVGVLYAPGSSTSVRFGGGDPADANEITGAIISGGDVDVGNNIGISYDAAAQAAVGAISTCASAGAVASFGIAIGAAAASTCTPKSITITARDSAGSTITGYTGSVNLTTSTSRGDWALATGAGTLANGAANDGAATYTFAAADNGVVVLNLSNNHADDLTLTAVDASAPSTSTTSATINFRDNAFVFTLDAIQVAGKPQSIGVALWRRDPSTGVCAIATGYSGSKALDAWITRDALDPSGAAPTVGALSLPSAAPAVNAASNNLTLAFSAGTATIGLATTDVGKYAFNLRDDTRSFASGVDISGASSSITTRPFALGFTEVKKGAGTCSPLTGAPICNAGGTATAGAKFVAAGDTFSATVAGYLWSAVDDADANGLPDAGANVTDNGVTPSFAWATTLSATTPITPAGGVTGALGGSTGIAAGSYASGRAVASALTYAEVGSVTLRADAVNFLGTTGVSIAGTSAVVGRFFPGQFALLGGATTTPACVAGGYTYMGQSGITLNFVVEAQSVSGVRTQNYAAPGYTTGSVNAAAENADAGLDLSARLTLPTSAWVAGRYSISAGLAVFSRAANPDGPYDSLQIGVRVTDPDGALLSARNMNPVTTGDCVAAGTCTAIAVGASTKVRFGRLRIGNANGSELLPLVLPVEAQYWNGIGFTRHTDDSCTTLAAGNIALGPYRQRSGAVVSPTPTAVTVPAGAFTSGTKLLSLSAPGAGKGGTVDIAVNLGASSTENLCIADDFTTSGANLAWLRGRWCGTSYDRDPTARATFGIYRGAAPFVFQRENY